MQPAAVFTDPVCGMKIAPETAKGKTAYRGETYYFCNPKCLEKFSVNPAAYLEKKSPAPARALPGGTRYVYPMDPEVESDRPGDCPKCGMALEPEMPPLEKHGAENPELKLMTRKFVASLILTLPILAAMLADFLPHENFLRGLARPLSRALPQFFLATPVVLWGGSVFFKRGLASLRNLSPNMFTLISIGMGAAYFYSVAAVLLPELFPAAFRDPHTGRLALYFEPAAVIVVLVLLGQILELRARQNLRRHPRAPGTRAENGATGESRRLRSRRAARGRRGRGRSARAPRRESARGRRRHRRPKQCRRIPHGSMMRWAA
jgi:Cu+-exporting ATPase